MTLQTNIKYEVAISFLSEDVNIAQAIHDKLCTGFNVFFFPRNQEELAGSNGMESLRSVFLEESRLNVVVYRPKWGMTNWTAVEMEAIIDSCLRTQYRSIFLYVVETPVELKWLPENHIYFSAANYALDEAIGAIKARVQEQGGAFQPLTPLKKAALNQADEEYRQDRSSLLSRHGLKQIHEAVENLFGEIQRHCGELNSSGTATITSCISINRREKEQTCTLGGPRVSMLVSWYQPFGNSLDGAVLIMREFDEGIPSPGHFRFKAPVVLLEARFDPDLSRAREVGWCTQHGDRQFKSSQTLASELLIQFLELIDKDAAGKISRESPW